METNPEKSREQLEIDRAIDNDIYFQEHEVELLQVVATLAEEFEDEV